MNIVEKIKSLKEEKNALLLVHCYQRPELQNIADFLGDSLGLARKAATTDKPFIVFCGVYFMAETAKILSPEKKVVIPRRDAGCPMANMIDAEELSTFKQEHPKAKVVTYVNSTAQTKALSDICCTSANAVNVVNSIDSEEVLFVPDQNLASYCQRFSKKKIIPWNGYCYVHNKISVEEVKRAKSNFPHAALLVHPECSPEVIDMADATLSTSQMIKHVENSDNEEFLIGTEQGLIQRLQTLFPKKKFYPAGSTKTCLNMKKTTLEDVYKALKEEKHEVNLEQSIIEKSKISLEAMLNCSAS